MQTIHNFLSRMKEKTFAGRYPEYDFNDGKTHVLYFFTYANGTGFYRVVLPYLHLNETTTHSAIVANIGSWDFNNPEPIKVLPDDKLLRWAHYVVLATLMFDVMPWVKKMKKVNPGLKFVMDIDDNPFRLPVHHPQFDKITNQNKINLIDNMTQMDLITSPNEKLLEFMCDRIEANTMNGLPDTAIIPNLLSIHLFDEAYFKDEFQPPQNKRIKIGMIMNEVHASDVKAIQKPLQAIKKEYGDKIDLVNIGWDGKYMNIDFFEGLDITIVPGVPFPQYFNLIRDQHFDFGIVPLGNTPEFNQYKAPQRWLEFAAFRVPVIVGDSEVYTEIANPYNSFVVNDNGKWFHYLENVIQEGVISKLAIGNNAYNKAWLNCSWNNGWIKELTEIFE